VDLECLSESREKATEERILSFFGYKRKNLVGEKIERKIDKKYIGNVSRLNVSVDTRCNNGQGIFRTGRTVVVSTAKLLSTFWEYCTTYCKGKTELLN